MTSFINAALIRLALRNPMGDEASSAGAAAKDGTTSRVTFSPKPMLLTSSCIRQS